MNTSAIDKEMFSCFMQLNEAEKKSVVEMLKTFLKGRITNHDNEDSIDIEVYNRDIEDALSRIEKGALHHFLSAVEYIAQDSLQSAEKVQSEILSKIQQLAHYPVIYSPDKYKKRNDGSFRAFELHRYRISYHVTEEYIRILSIRHTSRKPGYY